MSLFYFVQFLIPGFSLKQVIPPPEWKPRQTPYKLNGISIKPIHQVATKMDHEGFYQLGCIFGKTTTAKKYKELVASETNMPPNCDDHNELHRLFWEELDKSVAIYGSDVNWSFFDETCKIWNMNDLPNILQKGIKEDYGMELGGITNPYLYFGSWKSTFPWHTEDMDLYAISYLHFGAPKFWNAIPPIRAHDFEKFARNHCIESFKSCPNFLRHKRTIIEPRILRANNIPVNEVN